MSMEARRRRGQEGDDFEVPFTFAHRCHTLVENIIGFHAAGQNDRKALPRSRSRADYAILGR
jgi:hypothetical protein